MSTDSGLDYARARAVRENYLARLAKLEYEERLGKLLSRDEVTVAAFNRFRTFRDGISVSDLTMTRAERHPVQAPHHHAQRNRSAVVNFGRFLAER